MKARWIGLGIGAALCLAACGDAARPAVVEGSASPADGMPGAGVVAAATAPYARAERALAAGRILAPAVVLFGTWQFCRERVYDCLFGRTAFVFYDFSVPLPVYMLKYLFLVTVGKNVIGPM